MAHDEAGSDEAAQAAETAETAETASRRLLERINEDGRIFLSHTELGGRYTIRLVVGSVHTGPAQLEIARDAVATALDDIYSSH